MHRNRAPYSQNQSSILQNQAPFFCFQKRAGYTSPISCSSGVEAGNRNLENRAQNGPWMAHVLLLQCRFFDQNYQPGKITLQVSILVIKYSFGMSFGKGNMCCIFGFWQVVWICCKMTRRLKRGLLILSKKKF